MEEPQAAPYVACAYLNCNQHRKDFIYTLVHKEGWTQVIKGIKKLNYCPEHSKFDHNPKEGEYSNARSN